MPFSVPADLSEYSSLQAESERWGVSVDTLRRLISAGKLPAYRLNGRILRVRRADVDACFKPVVSAKVGGVR